MSPSQPIKLAIVDDHTLFRKGLISLIQMISPHYEIQFECANGIELQQHLTRGMHPDIVLMDINMPVMNGFEAVQWLTESFPGIKVIVISMIESEESVVKMLKLGVKGYLCKDIEPGEMSEALNAVANKGFYYTDFITGKLVHSLANEPEFKIQPFENVNDREMQFLKLACSELTYNEIADKMFLSPKTIDGYRNSLFEKLNVKSRVGLALYAVKHGAVVLG